MSYKAQLVVRARGKEGVAIVDKVKELASEEGKTYSEMAVELLGRGLNADASVDDTFSVDDEDEEVEEVEETQESEETQETKPPEGKSDEVEADDKAVVAKDLESTDEDGNDKDTDTPPPALSPSIDASIDDPNAPLPAEEAGPAVDPNLPIDEIVAAYIERRQDRGDRAAARILVDFFAEAEAQTANNLKRELRQELGEEEFETIMDPVENTPEYRNYIQRVLFEKPSKYSSLS